MLLPMTLETSNSSLDVPQSYRGSLPSLVQVRVDVGGVDGENPPHGINELPAICCSMFSGAQPYKRRPQWVKIKDSNRLAATLTGGGTRGPGCHQLLLMAWA